MITAEENPKQDIGRCSRSVEVVSGPPPKQVISEPDSRQPPSNHDPNLHLVRGINLIYHLNRMRIHKARK
jgi:hypothetical protein